MNEILFFLTVFVSFTGIVVTYRLFGKVGMWTWMAMATLLANIEAVKCVEIFGLSTILGNVVYGSTFLSTDILSENHGKNEAKTSVWVGLFFMVVSTLMIQVSLLFVPNEADFAHDSMKTVFSLIPRFTIASLITYFISNRLDVFLYHFFSKKTKYVWVRNNGATLIAQFVDTLLFVVLSYVGIFDFNTMLEIFVSTYLIKAIIAVFDTPFLYWAKRIHDKGKDGWLFRRETPAAEAQS